MNMRETERTREREKEREREQERERERGLLTHPVFLVYELWFEEEVWIACHHHHMLQLTERERDVECRKD